MNWSPLQLAIFSFLTENEQRPRANQRRESIVISANAGCGKTATCIEAIRRLSALGTSCGYVMFNRRTVDEFREKTNGLRVTSGTAHEFGSLAFRTRHPKARQNLNKVREIINTMFSSLPRDEKTFLNKLVKFAKQAAFGVSTPSTRNPSDWRQLIDHFALHYSLKSKNPDIESLISAAMDVLDQSNSDLSSYDFADMIYLTLLTNSVPPKFDVLFIDEAQDTNYANRTLYSRMLKPWGCAVIVGDQSQAMYGFTGADNDSMKLLTNTFHAHEYPLNISYRCAKLIIAEAQKYVPAIQPAPDAADGYVKSLKYSDFIRHPSLPKLNAASVILCRFNAPNVSLAFQLIRQGIGCRIEGRDIGQALTELLEKVSGLSSDPRQIQSLLYDYLRAQIKKHQASDDHAAITHIQDTCAALDAVLARTIELNGTIIDTRSLIVDMFRDTGDPDTPPDILTLSTVHKAKGREWHRVFILGFDSLMPAPRARPGWELEQENNIIYVAITRAKQELIYITDLPK